MANDLKRSCREIRERLFALDAEAHDLSRTDAERNESFRKYQALRFSPEGRTAWWYLDHEVPHGT